MITMHGMLKTFNALILCPFVTDPYSKQAVGNLTLVVNINICMANVRGKLVHRMVSVIFI